MTKQIDKIMEQAQVFASAWSLVGGRFDGGTAMDDAEVAKNELRQMVKEALAEQPAQHEPVAVVSGYYGGQCVILPIDPARIFNSNTALYTTPPQRTWVGLGDEEISARAANFYNPEMYKRAVLWAQEKLKERNQ